MRSLCNSALRAVDRHFVPNLTIGPPIIACLRKHTTAFLDCHCMVSRPRQWIAALGAAGASQLTFHPEALQAVQGSSTASIPTASERDIDRRICYHVEEFDVVVNEIKDAGMKVGVAIKPNTSLDSLLPLIERRIDDISLVLVMTVEPGFGGQSFMPDMMDKVRRLRRRFARLNIQVDGGLSTDTIDTAGTSCLTSYPFIY